MKKILTILAATATMFAFGTGQEPDPQPQVEAVDHGADFEAFTAGDAFSAGLNDKAQSSNPYYWYTADADAANIISNYTGSGAGVPIASRPDKFAGASNSKYLQVETTGKLYRSVKDNGSSDDFLNITENNFGDYAFSLTNSAIYLDTLVKFTAADSVFGDDGLGADDKIAIEYVEHESEGDGDPTVTNFVIRAGFKTSTGLIATNYYAYLPSDPTFANFDKDAWHRLTVRTIPDVGDGSVGFVVYVDETNLVYSTDVSAGYGANDLDGTAGGFYNDDKHALFPSAVSATKLEGKAISAAAFSGNGSLDDVVFTTSTPNFIKAGEFVVVTINKGTGITGVTVTVGDDEVAPVDAAANPLVYNLAPGTTDFGLAVTPDLGNGYAFSDECVTDLQNCTWANNSVNITGASPKLTLNAIRNGFNLFDSNGDSISGTFQTLGEALAANGVAKIQLAYDYDVVAADIEGLGYIDLLQSITLDLNGKTLDGGKSDSNPLFMVSDGNFVIIDSVGGGKVVYDGPGIVYGASSYIGAVSGDLGPTFDGQLFFESGEGNVIRGKFDETSNTASGDEPAFLYLYYLGDGDSVASECKGLVSGYWVVEPQGGSEPTTYALTIPTVTGASATVTDKATSSVIADLTAIEDGTVVTVTWTPESGYKITAGDTEEITMDGNKTADAPTVVAITYATLTITPVANCTIVVSNATAEVASGATFDVDDAIVLTVYRTAAEGYELDGCAATENITMDQDRTVTAAVKQSGGSYPSYIDDATKQGKYNTWKDAMTAAGVDVGDGEAYEDAYLLNCKPAEVTDAKAAFKFTSISYDTTQSKWITTTTTSYNERGYNGEVVVKQYSDVGCKTESSAGTFFKAFLQ